MQSKLIRIGGAFVVGMAVLSDSGCCHKAECVKTEAPPTNACGPSVNELPAIPPNAKEGECYAKIYVPPTYKSVTERVLVREGSERLEAVPAEYEWVEERVLTKDAGSEVRTVPAEFAERDRTIEVTPARTDWEVKKSAGCEELRDQPSKDVYCLVKHPAEQKTVHEQYQVKPASTEETTIPAEYQTVRRQRLKRAATTNRVTIPAEYAEVTRNVKVCDARMAWKRIPCEESGNIGMEQPATRVETTPSPVSEPRSTQTAQSGVSPWWNSNAGSGKEPTVSLTPKRINAVKDALRKRGYRPGPNNGEIKARDLGAISKFQRDQGLPVTDLNEQTMRALNVGPQ
jgi:hypothetical protein